MKYFLTSLVLFMLSPSARAVEPQVVLELTRSLPQYQEVIIVRFDNGAEQILLNTNRLMKNKPETGLYQRRSTLLFSKLKTVQSQKPPDMNPQKRETIVPHMWQAKLFGKELSPNDPRIGLALVAVEQEMKDFAKWTPVDTVKVVANPKEVTMTYFKNSKATKTERASFAKTCNTPINSSIACKTEYGFVIL
jgi:hypothetical protein